MQKRSKLEEFKYAYKRTNDSNKDFIQTSNYPRCKRQSGTKYFYRFRT